MTDYIRIPTAQNYDLLRGVEPVAPYPRIDPQQGRQDGYQRQQAKPEAKPQVRRRFTAMRRLIEQLKDRLRIVRVDYNTADLELRSQGLAITEEELIPQLLQLKIPLDSVEELLHQVRLSRTSVLLTPGGRIGEASYPLFPVPAEGLSEYLLKFSDLSIGSGSHFAQIVETINNEGRFVQELNRQRLTCRRPGPDVLAAGDQLLLDFSVQLGVIEVDEDGRRAILYPRSEQICCLYSDKQIDLSI